MKSPLHSSVVLVKSELDIGLTSWRCPSSGGHWVPAPSYWKWHSELPPQLKEAQNRRLEKVRSPDFESQLLRPALICPESNCLLVRYKVGGIGIFIDRSPISGGIWLDAEEWSLLKENNNHASLHEILTSSYQKKILKEEAREALLHKFYSDLGEDTAEELMNLAEWLKGHPRRRRIISWLHEQLALDEDDFAPVADDQPLREVNARAEEPVKDQEYRNE